MNLWEAAVRRVQLDTRARILMKYGWRERGLHTCDDKQESEGHAKYALYAFLHRN